MNHISMSHSIEVVSYSGYKVNERPLYFFLEKRKLEVRKVTSSWYGEEDDWFRVLADDGRLYLIRWHRESDQWFLEK